MFFGFLSDGWAQIFSSPEEIFVFVILCLIFLLVMALILKLGLGLLNDVIQTEYIPVFLTSLAISVVFALTNLFLIDWVAWLVISIGGCFIINARHEVGFFGALFAIVVAIVLYLIVGFLLGAVFGVSLIVL